MTSHQLMRVFDLSLPEMQTQLLSKIESNDSTLCTFSLLCITYTQKGSIAEMIKLSSVRV